MIPRSLVLTILVLLTTACAGRDPYRKLPPEEKAFMEAVDIFLEPEEIKVYLDQDDPAARETLAKEFGVAEKWENLSDIEQEAILGGEVVKGIGKDAVLMILGTPTRLRRQYVTVLEGEEIADYVESFQYRYERTKKGEVFLSPPNSRTAFKNEVFEVHVDFLNGAVISIRDVQP